MTKYKIRGTTFPSKSKTIKEDELEHYRQSDHWEVIGESSHTPGANVISEEDTDSEELTTKTDEEGNEVAELGASDERPLELSNAPESMHVDPDSPTAQRWLTEFEREKLRQQDNPEQVDEMAKSEEEFWGEIRSEVEELEEAAKAEEKRKKMESTVENREWLKPDHMTTKVKDMTGEQFAKALNGDTPENVEEALVAELAEAEAKARSDEEAEEASQVDPEVLEEAASVFSEKGGYWQDIADDIRAEELGDVDSVRFGDFGDDTDITLKDTGDDKLAEISTESAELQEEIRAVAEETDAKILKETGGKMLAEVRRSDVKEFHQ